MVPTKLRMGSTHTHTHTHTLSLSLSLSLCEYSNNSMHFSQLASSNTNETNILFLTHTHNFYCERLTFDTMFVTVFYTQLLLWMADIWDYVCHYVYILYTQLLLWTANIWDTVCHYILYTIYYSPGAINGQSMAEKNIKKRIQFLSQSLSSHVHL